MKKYSRYKPSGVEWLGEVPEGWETWKISHGYHLTGSGTTPPSDNADWYEGDICWVTTGELRETTILDTQKKVSDIALSQFSALKLFPPGTLLVAMYGATIGRLGILGVEATTNQACCALALSKIFLNQFVFYWLQAFKETIVILASGGGQPNISQEKVRAIEIPAPPLPEQQAIATYLDRETGRTDTLIDKKQRIVELLKEKRVAMVSRAVTKGLDPNVKMKPSGVEWLGEVPEHWEVKKLKHRAVIRYGIGEPPEYVVEGVPLIRATNVNAGKIESANLVRVDPSDIPGARIVWLKAGDIIVVRSGAYTGDSSIIPKAYENSIAGFDMVVSVRNAHSGFVAYALLSKYLKDGQICLEKLRAAQPHLNAEELGNCTLLLPPLPEQQTISTYLDRETAKLDTLISKVDTAIDTLKEYRTALISAAVTGKICVTDGLGGMKDEHK